MKRLISWVAAIFTATTLLVSIPAGAVEYGGVGGRPAHPRSDNPRTKSIFVLTLKPGETKSDGVRIYNNTDKERTISIGAVDSILASGGAFSCAQEAEPKVDVGKWINLDETSVKLGPNTNKVVSFKVTAPDNASAGEHDGCITIQDSSQTQQASPKSGVMLGFRSAIRVAVTIPGKIVKDLQFESITVSRANDGNYIVTPLVHNGGNVSLDSDVKASINSPFGGTQASTRQTYPVLPKSRTSWNFELKRPFWGGWYRAKASITYVSDTAHSLGAQGGEHKTITIQSGLFFARPSAKAAWIELLVLAGLIAVALVYIQSRRHHKTVRNQWVAYTAKKSDTLQSLAKKHDTTWKKLATANKLKPPYHINKGDELKVPPKK